jgi:hypothetical protein
MCIPPQRNTEILLLGIDPGNIGIDRGGDSDWKSGPMSPVPKRRWSFTLRTLFVMVTVLAAGMGWVAYHANWMLERKHGREWLDAHGVGGSIGFSREARPSLSWTLKMLGEQPLELFCIGALDDERRDLPEYRRRVAAISLLFPECQIVDIDAQDWPSDPANDEQQAGGETQRFHRSLRGGAY